MSGLTRPATDLCVSSYQLKVHVSSPSRGLVRRCRDIVERKVGERSIDRGMGGSTLVSELGSSPTRLRFFVLFATTLLVHHQTGLYTFTAYARSLKTCQRAVQRRRTRTKSYGCHKPVKVDLHREAGAVEEVVIEVDVEVAVVEVGVVEVMEEGVEIEKVTVAQAEALQALSSILGDTESDRW